MAESNFSRALEFMARISGASSQQTRAGSADLREMIPAAVTESMRSDPALETIEKISKGAEPGPADHFNLEAIIIPERRPAVLIQKGNFELSHADWMHLNAGEKKKTIRSTFASIGRIELPNHPSLPYGGTGFVVGDNILMTNRHVAEIFADGIGEKNLLFRPGLGADVDFLQEYENQKSDRLNVKKVLMIHPYWDMALIRVEGLSKKHRPLNLSLLSPDDMLGKDVVVIGYPAFDPRNNAAVQNKVFGGIYNVKRLQPRKIGAGKRSPRANFESYGKPVSALMHDASTLGGNSGSAVLDPETGDIVGLHFAGVHLDANYAVPAFELAKDKRVVDAGVVFAGKLAPPQKNIHQAYWDRADRRSEAIETDGKVAPATNAATPPQIDTQSGQKVAIEDKGGQRAMAHGSGEVRITVPLEITVRIGSDIRPQEATIATGPTTKQSLPRDASDVARGPLTFRDPALSIFQSVAAAVAKKQTVSVATEGAHAAENPASAEVILAAEAVARAASEGKTIASHAPGQWRAEELAGLAYPSYCAGLAFDLIKAKISGDQARIREIQDRKEFGQCDPAWASTISEYFGAYGLLGDPSQRVYVTPAQAGDKAIAIKPGARIGIIGDWGTGARPARVVLQQLKEQKPDIVIHLGDIYYSGTDAECRDNFENVINEVLERRTSKIPVYNICGNHDMYCGGGGYFSMLRRLNAGANQQKASFFCLRSTDGSWQFLGFDTGRNDYKVHSIADAITFVEDAEAEWLLKRVKEFPGRTVLLSHHPMFSAFSAIGAPDTEGLRNPCNTRLKSLFDTLAQTGKKIPAWFWGHEHNLGIYAPYAGLDYGRCVGHSAIPVPEAENAYATVPGLREPPQILPKSQLAIEDGYYCNGFAMLTLGTASMKAEYFENRRGTSRLVFSEMIA